MQIIEADQVKDILRFDNLIPLLRDKFAQQFTTPQRQVFPLDETSNDAFALLPAWNEQALSVKAFTYFPQNANNDHVKSIYSKILLFNRNTGEPLAMVDGTEVTYWRTAAVSALASELLSRNDSQTMLLFGSGGLAQPLINAHLQVRSLNKVMLAARSPQKAQRVIDNLRLQYPAVDFSLATDLPTDIGNADIICCATTSSEPLFDGDWVQAGTHIDCLGNHNSGWRECDSKCVVNAKAYVDSLENCLAEAGELLIPIDEGVLRADDIVGELSQMCSATVPLREEPTEITFFKSVGMALGDLVTAYYVYQKLNSMPS